MVCRLHSNKTRGGMRAVRMPVALALALIAASCYEDLPPVEQPEVVQSVGVSFNVARDGIVYLNYSNDLPTGGSGALVVNVTNIFTEYAADDEQVEVEIDMYMKGHPERSAVVTMTKDDLMTPGVLSHGVLAIAPGQVITFQKQWSHHALGNSFITWAIIDSASEVSVDPGTGKPHLAVPVRLMVQASIKVFKSRPTEYYPADRKKYKEFLLYYARI